MDCKNFQTQIDRLVAGELSQNETEQLHRHVASCPECTDYYNQIQTVLEALTPRVSPDIPSSLKQTVLQRAARGPACKIQPVRRRLWGTFSRVAAAVAVLVAIGTVILVGIQPARAEVKLLERSAKRMGEAKTVAMTLNVRTLENENFAYIDAKEPMVGHSLKVIPVERKWRLEKKGRILVSDGRVQHAWLPSQKFGWIDTVNANMAEDFAIFFDPKQILLYELRQAKEPGTESQLIQSGDEIRLIVTAKAKGDFANDYMLNSSIGESDNRREYVFDRASELLKSLKVYIREKDADVLVLETTSIEYDTPFTPEVFTSLPKGYIWSDLRKEMKSPQLKGLSAEETVAKMFRALSAGDIAPVKAALASYDTQLLLETFRGCSVLKQGKLFKSGQYPGVFIPCEIRLRNAEVKRYNIAVRNDNPDGIWMLDGGI